MTRTHIVHAVTNVVSIGLLTVFMLLFLALFFGCQAPASSQSAPSIAAADPIAAGQLSLESLLALRTPR
jgi:hypothetical protein